MIQANQAHQNGIGWKELAVAGATGLAGLYLYTNRPQPTPPPATPPAVIQSQEQPRPPAAAYSDSGFRLLEEPPRPPQN